MEQKQSTVQEKLLSNMVGKTKKRQYKRDQSRPVKTGLAKRSPTFTIKNGFQERSK